MLRPPGMDEEWARKPLRARLLPGKDHELQELSDCMGRDGAVFGIQDFPTSETIR